MNDELDVKTGVTDTLPTVLAAVVSKSLMVVVIVGSISLAVVRCFGLMLDNLLTCCSNM